MMPEPPARPRALNRVARALTVGLGLIMAGAPGAAQEFVVSFGGDVNFSRSYTAPLPDRIVKVGVLPLATTTDTLRPFWAGADLNIINVETVVSDRDGASPAGKQFVFRSHPDSFRHLMDLGVNGFALANNHAYDHGRQGMADTLAFFRGEVLRRPGPLLFAGIGEGAAAFAPAVAEIAGVRVAFASASFGSGSFGPEQGATGMAYLSVPSHYAAVLQGLARAQADLRILALHHGTENVLTLDPGQRALFRRGLDEAGVNLVLGHHPHVVRAVEADPGRGQAVFYSLGNLLFVGGAEKDSGPPGADFGLLGRAVFQRDRPGGPWRISVLEGVPLQGVHVAPRLMAPGRAAQTLARLNRLSDLSVGAASAVRFDVGVPEAQTGLACFAPPWGPAARRLCCAAARSGTPQCDLPDPM
jgi:hypothetical protein